MFRAPQAKASNMMNIKKGVGRVEIKAETSAPGDSSRRRRFAPKSEYTVYEKGALVRGPSFEGFVPRLRGATDDGEQPPEFVLNDSRATALNVGFVNSKFYCGPSLERFSGHTGVCRVLGNMKLACVPHSLQLGDLLRFGSVGLVVCEINRGDSDDSSEVLSEEDMSKLKLHYLSLPHCDTTIGENGEVVKHDLGSDEDGEDYSSGDEDVRPHPSQGRKPSEGKDPSSERFCYICYDGDGDDQNPLVSPCMCKGDTKYVHLACLQRWNNNDDATGSKPKVCVVTNTAGVDLCSICKSPYKTSVRLDSGKMVSLLAAKLPPPYVTFAVVTRHEVRSRSTTLTNTRFQLSFSSFPNPNGAALTIGRSTSNDMVLRYRTVSQVHARVKFQNGQFWLHDANSSNGTMLFLNKPLELEFGKSFHIKMGRTIMTMKAKKRWRWNFAENMVGRSDSGGEESPHGLSILSPRGPLPAPAPDNNATHAAHSSSDSD